MVMKKERKINVIVEFTEGYEERFTKAILKLYENRERERIEREEKEIAG